MNPGATMQQRARRQADTARKAREFAASYVADLPQGIRPQDIRLQLAERAGTLGIDRTVLWIAVRDEMRKSR